jgi:predicted kinase
VRRCSEAEEGHGEDAVIYGRDVKDETGEVALFGGPSGAGKSTLARAWCATRPQAAHIELDEIRQLIISGRADPQEPSDLQAAQYRLSVEATCALARAFANSGCDVAIDDVFEPDAFERYWRPQLDGLPWKLVVVLPSLDETLARSARREKRVKEEHTRTQHARCAEWDAAILIDTTGLDLEQSLALALDRLQ